MAKKSKRIAKQSGKPTLVPSPARGSARPTAPWWLGDKEKVFSSLIYCVLFLFLIYPYADFDWGWHYRCGEYLLTHWAVLRRDIFSWIMDGYEWVNHSWLYDLLLYLIFRNFSFLGLSLAGAAVSLLTFYVGITPFQISWWQKGLLAIFFHLTISRGVNQGLRAQVVGFMLFSCLMHLLFRERGKKKWSYFLFPPLFLIWANLHGSFLLGLVIFGTFVLCEFILLFRSRVIAVPQNVVYLLISFLASMAATLANPFTYRVYLEVLHYFRNPLLIYVTEWLPSYFIPSALSAPLIVYTVLLALGFIFRRRLADLPLIVTSALLLYLAIGARRYIAIYVVVTLPFAALMLQEARYDVGRLRMAPWISGIVLAAFLAVALFERIPKFHLVGYSIREYCQFGPRCSEKLTQFLLQNPPVGRGLNFYDWGGYLIGRGIRAKLFIDGRMHLWERNGYGPFLDYWRIYNLPDMKKFSAYQFNWVIAETNSILTETLNGATEGSAFGRWARVYSDARATYFVRRE